jgi:hypothetical protein
LCLYLTGTKLSSMSNLNSLSHTHTLHTYIHQRAKMAKIAHEVAQTTKVIKADERKGGKVTLQMGEVPAVGTKEKELLDLRKKIKTMQVCMYVCMYMCTKELLELCERRSRPCRYVCMYLSMYVYVHQGAAGTLRKRSRPCRYVCVYLSMYVYVHQGAVT